jgi:2-polyprenyl-6-methoxyphenol hydroxylase-like FAD-dependent oxidoreductase
MMSNKTDVLIVGAGPVGMLTALALAQTGASVRVIEREGQIINSPRAAVYFPSTLLVLEELGILDELEAVGFRNWDFGTHIPEFGYHSVVKAQKIDGIKWDYQLHAGQHEVARGARRRGSVQRHMADRLRRGAQHGAPLGRNRLCRTHLARTVRGHQRQVPLWRTGL